MKESFERVQKHLYKRQYQTGSGDWATAYYARFVDWQGIRRKFAIGDDLEDARDELGRLHTLNKGRHDWDAEKRKAEEQRRRAITFSQWGKTYFDEDLSPNKLRPGSVDREKRAFALLEPFFGDLSLIEINKKNVLEYRKKRTAEGVGFITINRELAFLRKLLNVATDQEPPLLESIPRFKLPNETSRARSGTKISAADTYQLGVAPGSRRDTRRATQDPERWRLCLHAQEWAADREHSDGIRKGAP
jgi:hypothetical protein